MEVDTLIDKNGKHWYYTNDTKVESLRGIVNTFVWLDNNCQGKWKYEHNMMCFTDKKDLFFYLLYRR